MMGKRKLEFYADLSPLRKAWSGLWKRPRGNQKEAIELNEVLIKQIITSANEQLAKPAGLELHPVAK